MVDIYLEKRQDKCDKLRKENKKLKERVKQLEQRLDNKEKVNKQLREELGKMVMWNNTVEIVMSAWSLLTEQDDLSPFFMK